MRSWLLFLGAWLIGAGACAGGTMALQDEVLYPQVRVTSGKGGGSGTVIYSEKAEGGFYSTYILSCHHVISEAITVADKWNPVLQKQEKAESRQPVIVEFFNYKAVPHGKSPLTSGVRAEIVAYDIKHDMVLLQVRLADRPAVAKLLPKNQIEGINIGDPVVAVGCALLHDPILTFGQITHMGDVIDYVDYWMSNASIIFGNSGGAMFLAKGGEYHFIGIPSRVDVIGWGSAVTHCGYFSPISRIYTFFEEQVMDFLVPGSNRNEAQCLADLTAKREQAKKDKD